MLHRDTRVQALAMLGALVLAPDPAARRHLALAAARDRPSPPAGGGGRRADRARRGGGAAWVLSRRPALLAGAVIVALPFRIPIAAGGVTSNLLVPLYFVVAAGSLAFIVTALRGRGAAAATPSATAPRLAASPRRSGSSGCSPATSSCTRSRRRTRRSSRPRSSRWCSSTSRSRSPTACCAGSTGRRG